MAEKQLHLVRHGEVHNPHGVLYGRIPGYRLSELGAEMAAAAADDLQQRDRRIARLYASPLQRTQESAEPIARFTGLPIITEHRIIEPTNFFEGLPNHGKHAAFRQIRYWHKLWNPFRPSWGEPYSDIAARVREAMDEAWDEVEASVADGTDKNAFEGDIVMVSHQSPIWITHRSVAGERLFHDPRTRRCELSSITSFTRRNGEWFEVGYSHPAEPLMANATDIGAV
ncbi:histidine phosphatase family protein [Lysinibacter sp. HNR]|uniref:histidine phosphatase family protein n=1 Tax=Lysinibacter sp. HNR TaxID=3031408 RepID=UPI002435A432|nr:histidine phosphatase family protein [Lysinibacter sp. HNR]WGD37793.1 histidine phosphatase family protein [Lysinibacter sp. HNR]